MNFKKEVLLVFFITLFFSIDFIRELLLFVNPNIINLLSLLFGTIIIVLVGNLKINSKLVGIYLSILFFMVISILNGFYKGFIDKHTIIYSMYKFFEITIVAIIASNISKKQLVLFYERFVKFFYIIHTPIFIYYILVILGILTHYNRLVAFDTRFGGLAGEPAQYGQMALVVLFALFSLKKYYYVNNIRIKVLIFSVFVLTSLSNAFFIPLIIFIIYYYFKQKTSLIKLVLYYFIAIFTISSMFFINERLNIDFEQLWFVIINFNNLAHISVDGVGINSVTTRFFEVAKTLSLTTHLIGNGIGSAINFPSFSGLVGDGKSIAFYGISQVGYELGLIPMFLFIIWFIKQISFTKLDLFNKSALITIFFVMLTINGISFKLYWFMLFIILMDTIRKEKYETPNNPQ